jgi:F-type H+-transporting ATPase subunit b
VTQGHPSWSWIFNFALLGAILVYFLRKPLRASLFGRRDKIAKAVEESERLRLDVDRMMLEYEGKLGELDAEIAQLMAEAKADGERECERIVERARQTADKIMEEARQAAARETERVKRVLQKEVVEQAILEATKMLRGKVSEKEHQLFLDEFVKGLEAGSGPN